MPGRPGLDGGQLREKDMGVPSEMESTGVSSNRRSGKWWPERAVGYIGPPFRFGGHSFGRRASYVCF